MRGDPQEESKNTLLQAHLQLLTYTRYHMLLLYIFEACCLQHIKSDVVHDNNNDNTEQDITAPPIRRDRYGARARLITMIAGGPWMNASHQRYFTSLCTPLVYKALFLYINYIV